MRSSSPVRGIGSLPGQTTSVLLACALMAACGDRPGGPGTPTANGAPSSVASTVEIPASSVHLMGGSEAIASVRDLTVLENGSVWILNSVEPYFVGFGAEGGTPITHGAAGGGPTEFDVPTAFVTGGDGDEAWVFDYRRHALVRVSTPDEAREEIALPRDALPPGSLVGGMSMLDATVRTARLGEEIVLARTSGSMRDGVFGFRMAVLRPDFVALDPATGETRTLLSMSEVMEDPSAGLERADGGFPLWYRLWATCPDDRLVVYDRVQDALRSFGPDGSEGASFALPPHDLSDATPEEIARAAFQLRAAEAAGAVGRRMAAEDSAAVMRELVGAVREERSQMAAYLPRYVDLRCASDGAVWLRLFDRHEGELEGGLGWLRVASDGTVESLRFPERFDPYRFTDERIWGVQRDSLDVGSVAWIEAPRR